MRLYDENGNKVRGRRPLRRLMTAAAAGGMMVGVVAMGGIGPFQLAVAPPDSVLQATPSTLPTLDVVNAPTSTSVNVKLDSNCIAAFKVGQSYTITAVSSDPGIATVSPSVSNALQCAGSGANFTVTAVCNGTTTLNFEPVAGPKGIQDKVAGTTVSVTVTNATSATCGTTPPPGGGTRPAAPAVANAYLNANSALVAACKTAFASSKNAWRGALISTIADWMPKPESIKDDTTAYPTANDWISYVQAKVNALCGY
jgi:hypothetical protein